MKKSAIVMLVFSLIFVVSALAFLVFASIFGIISLVAYFGPNSTDGDKIGSFFVFIAMIPYCLGMFASGLLILPFNITMIKKMEIKTWFTKAILIFAIVMMALAIIFVIVFPLAVNIAPASSGSSTSSIS